MRQSQRGAVRCLYLESDAGLGKSMLITALCRDPALAEQAQRIDRDGTEAGLAKTGGAEEERDQFAVLGERKIRVVKVQVRCHIWRTPEYLEITLELQISVGSYIGMGGGRVCVCVCGRVPPDLGEMA